MIPYQAIDINFNGTPEQCFVIEIIGSIRYLIPQKYIVMDSTISADIDEFNTASGAYPKVGGLLDTRNFKVSNGTSFYSTYHSLIQEVANKPDHLGSPYDSTAVYKDGATWKNSYNDTAV